MFEKEAEEIANKKLCSERICYNHCNFNSPKHHRCGEWHRIYECAKESAEFGYNKANEWHYVKDGDYPKEKGNYLVAWKRTHYVEEFGEWGFDVDLFNADEGYFEGVGDYVIAWKEIVLPELKECEECTH